MTYQTLELNVNSPVQVTDLAIYSFFSSVYDVSNLEGTDSFKSVNNVLGLRNTFVLCTCLALFAFYNIIIKN